MKYIFIMLCISLFNELVTLSQKNGNKLEPILFQICFKQH